MLLARCNYFWNLVLHYPERQLQKFQVKNYLAKPAPTSLPSEKESLLLCVAWLASAQDTGHDNGISRGFSLVYDSKFGTSGWQPSYPETSGYIIPTLLRCAEFLKEPVLIERSKKIAAWEMSIMTSEGGIPGGNIGKKPEPAVFDTGQVIRGFVALFEKTNDTHYLDAATRAANWILNNEALRSGKWFTHNADSVNNATTTYNVYAIVPIAYLGKLTHNNSFVELGKRVAEATLEQQNTVGWFNRCDFEDRPDALLHTLAYTIDGLWDLGTLLNNEKYHAAARLSIDNLLRHLDAKGLPQGRFDKTWNPTTPSYCLTGIAQIALTALKIQSTYTEKTYSAFIERVISFLISKQNRIDPHFGGLGAVWGSWPIDGDYQPYQALNWAVKYLADLLIMYEQKNISTPSSVFSL